MQNGIFTIYKCIFCLLLLFPFFSCCLLLLFFFYLCVSTVCDRRHTETHTTGSETWAPIDRAENTSTPNDCRYKTESQRVLMSRPKPCRRRRRHIPNKTLKRVLYYDSAALLYMPAARVERIVFVNNIGISYANGTCILGNGVVIFFFWNFVIILSIFNLVLGKFINFFRVFRGLFEIAELLIYVSSTKLQFKSN